MKSYLIIGICIFGLLLTTSALAEEVVQGECLEYNMESKIIKIKEYDTNFSKEAKYGVATNIESEYDVSQAKIGAKPEPGNILRIAYRNEDNRKIATKVMNVTKQDLMKK
ncbi:MAG: hypothetical protein AB1724_15450 [Thermodesulfobacteriota bacterium]